ncbi:MAG: peptide chain release factor N(5)-glutamine methyltransferase [Actinomycetota bacterium]
MTVGELVREAAARLRAAGLPTPEVDARRIVERAAGLEPSEYHASVDQPATRRTVGFFDQMLARRERGEPLQYVVGRWSFRTLELLVDPRVLIPRPETEVVVEHALSEARRLAARTIADLGTGSGAIALAMAAELGPEVEVWATDRSADALAVARANLAGIGRAATRVRLVEGNWFAALPPELRGRIDLVVSNPPYVAEADEVPAEVVDWEPRGALIAGPTGTEAIERIVADALTWLARPGVLVVEIAPHQAERAVELARAAGFHEASVEPDLTGRPRVVLAYLMDERRP